MRDKEVYLTTIAGLTMNLEMPKDMIKRWLSFGKRE